MRLLSSLLLVLPNLLTGGYRNTAAIYLIANSIDIIDYVVYNIYANS